MGVELWRAAAQRMREAKDAVEKAAEAECAERERKIAAAAEEFDRWLASDYGKDALELLQMTEQRVILCSVHSAGRDGDYDFSDMLTGKGLERFQSGYRDASATSVDARTAVEITRDRHRSGDSYPFLPWLIGELDKIARGVLRGENMVRR